ncbi:MAG TPA: hypothetical protein VIV60_06810 [Polyangiaceae bacterium]
MVRRVLAYRRVFWASILPLGAVTVWATQHWTSLLAAAPSGRVVQDATISEISGSCSPEPQEQLLLILSLVIPIGLAFFVTVAFRSMGIFRRRESSHPLLSALAFASQSCLVAIGLNALAIQGGVVFGYRFFAHPPLLGAIFAAGFILACAQLFSRAPWTIRTMFEAISRVWWLPWLIAMSWVVAFAITGVFREVDLPHATGTVQLHVPYTMGEYAAVLNGRVPLVDFFSQYQNLFGLLVRPIFTIVGFSVGSFTTVMATLTVGGFALVYATFCRICRSRWIALVFFVPLVALGFYRELLDTDVYLSNAFNYYAVGPLRYFGVCVLAWISTFYLGRPSLARLSIAASVALLVALNNLDFGIPAAVGTLGCVLLFPPRFGGLNLPARIGTSASLFVAVASATMGIYCLCIRMLAGAWPLLGQLTAYQKSFALLGCFMMPMPTTGLHWVLQLTAVSAVIVPIFETFSCDHNRIAADRRLINGGLAFAGLAAMGPLAYYVGRSHILVLEAIFFSWGLVLFQFMHRNWRQWRDAVHRRRQPGDYLLAMPLAAALGLCVMVSSMMSEVPRPDKQWARLTTKFPGDVARDKALVDLIAKHSEPGETTVIAYPNAHLLAIHAGVNNVFPFAHTGSLLLKDQLNVVTAAMTRLPQGREFFYGNPVSEMRVRLQEGGYHRIDGIDDFDVWSKGQQ